MSLTVLVTGAAGYIGSHTVLELLNAGHEVIGLDNLSNSNKISLARVQRLAGKDFLFVQGDIGDRVLLEQILSSRNIDVVIHFAGLKAVGESVKMPLLYYHNNVVGTVQLCQAMVNAGIRRLVFSSSATVYGRPASVPINECFPVSAVSPYGQTKLMIESILRDLAYAGNLAGTPWRIAMLRYFNPVGAHESGWIGEDPKGTPNNLMPYISQVAVGRLPHLCVFGNDYPTPDGTGVRDYIHVMDLARGHMAALDAVMSTRNLGEEERDGVLTVNLGTGHGYSVLELVKAFSQASGRPIPYVVTSRRDGDVAECYADVSYAAKILGWKAEYNLARMCIDTWRWQSANPYGFSEN